VCPGLNKKGSSPPTSFVKFPYPIKSPYVTWWVTGYLLDGERV
jgi:hypothetical protein